jgi:hypothetical protein
MRIFVQRVVLLLALVVIGASVLVLEHANVENPTGRRYASDPVPAATGEPAERVLSADLNVPNNNVATQRQCACKGDDQSTAPPAGCNVCFVHSAEILKFRIPDFVTTSYIAESKNTVSLVDERRQLTDYATIAEALDIPLWVYVRQDTTVQVPLRTMIEDTGGGVVFYFVPQGYRDPYDTAAQIAIAASLVVFFAMLIAGRLLHREPRPKIEPSSAVPPPSGDGLLDQMEQLKERTRRRAEREELPHDDE